MISTLSLFILLVPAASSRSAQLPPRRAMQHPTTIAITHGTIIDVAHGSRVADRTVVVRGNRILSVAGGRVAPPAGTHAVVGDGKVLIPGPWDMHGHVYPHAKEAPTDERA